MPAPIKVLVSLENSAGDRCVDIFARDDGTFGFEEYRKDPEDERRLVFASSGEITGGMDDRLTRRLGVR
jgi:hypothetical protein